MFDLSVELGCTGVFIEFYVGLYVVGLVFFVIIAVFVLLASNPFKVYCGFHISFCFVDGEDDVGI